MAKVTSVMLISDDQGVENAVTLALAGKRRVKLTAENRSVSGLNGAAVRMAAEHDIIVFATDPGNKDDMNAIRALNAERSETSIFLALTDRDIQRRRGDCRVSGTRRHWCDNGCGQSGRPAFDPEKPVSQRARQ